MEHTSLYTYALWNNYWNNLIWTDVVLQQVRLLAILAWRRRTQTCRDTLAVTIGNRQTNFFVWYDSYGHFILFCINPNRNRPHTQRQKKHSRIVATFSHSDPLHLLLTHTHSYGHIHTFEHINSSFCRWPAFTRLLCALCPILFPVSSLPPYQFSRLYTSPHTCTVWASKSVSEWVRYEAKATIKIVNTIKL